jgi:GDPmannose 4,6-dehydratase
MKKALVTGALGQDGSYMCEYLLSLGYEVWGTVRYEAKNKREHENYVLGVNYRFADMRDKLSLETLIRQCHPDEIYNFAGQVFVPTSWTQPEETFDVNTNGLARILSIVEKVCPSCKIYQASSSEMYGNIIMKPRSLGLSTSSLPFAHLTENSPMHPVSPYGVSKFAAHKLVDVYRNKGLYIVSGIAFNHESPRRGSEMVTRKITKYMAEVKDGKNEVSTLRLGNPDAKRDWGFAGDFVKAMHKSLQQEISEDYVIGTGEVHSVREFVNAAIGCTDIKFNFGDIQYNCIEFNRPNELYCLIADYSKAKQQLGWQPETSFHDLVKMMVDADYKRYQNILVEEAASV